MSDAIAYAYSHPAFGKEAVRALKRWRFEPRPGAPMADPRRSASISCSAPDRFALCRRVLSGGTGLKLAVH